MSRRIVVRVELTAVEHEHLRATAAQHGCATVGQLLTRWARTFVKLDAAGARVVDVKRGEQ